MTIIDHMQALTDWISSKGIPATMDPRDAEAPGAIVDLESVGEDPTLCDRMTAKVTVWLVVPDNGHFNAIKKLLELYDSISEITTGASLAELQLPDSAPLPALKLNPITLEDD